MGSEPKRTQVRRTEGRKTSIKQQKATAKSLGVSVRTLRRWELLKGFPAQSSTGEYDVDKIRRWRNNCETLGVEMARHIEEIFDDTERSLRELDADRLCDFVLQQCDE